MRRWRGDGEGTVRGGKQGHHHARGNVTAPINQLRRIVKCREMARATPGWHPRRRYFGESRAKIAFLLGGLEGGHYALGAEAILEEQLMQRAPPLAHRLFRLIRRERHDLTREGGVCAEGWNRRVEQDGGVWGCLRSHRIAVLGASSCCVHRCASIDRNASCGPPA